MSRGGVLRWVTALGAGLFIFFDVATVGWAFAWSVVRLLEWPTVLAGVAAALFVALAAVAGGKVVASTLRNDPMGRTDPLA